LALRLTPTATPVRKAGTATLASGTVTVPDTGISASDVVIVSRRTAGGTTGTLTYSITAGASFTISSTSVLETSTVAYLVVRAT
jgi:hypothetical protein